FPVLGNFIQQASTKHPEMVLPWLDISTGPLTRFLPGMLAGLMLSESHTNVREKIEGWINTGTRLSDIAWYLRFADPFQLEWLSNVLQKGIQAEDTHTICNCVDAAVRQFDKNPNHLIEQVLLPAIEAMAELNDTGWLETALVPWLRAPILLALKQDQAIRVLDSLVPYPTLNNNSEYVTAAIAENWPDSVLEFLTQRMEYRSAAQKLERYEAIPSHPYQLPEHLAKSPTNFINAAKNWYQIDGARYRFEGAELIARAFPEIPDELFVELKPLAKTDPCFVLDTLSAFDGHETVYPLVQEVIANSSGDKKIMRAAHHTLHESGVVSGEFGYVKLYKERKNLIEPWLDHENKAVQDFAEHHLADLESSILNETKRAEASIAARKLSFGEEIESDDESED
ncbi:hypothetical protein, partial [Sphingorhabdus sp. Alg239-R122]|uniref:hypothetical protein n=1 Tax=Sphingorhabdus sp. Alg239-R122 TaxID=2305989 RepID=UPI0019670030